MIIIGKSPTLISGVPSCASVDAIANVRRGDEPEPAAHRVPVHLRDDRLVAARQREQQIRVVALRAGARSTSPPRRHLREVAAGAERLPSPVEHDDAHVVVAARVVERVEELVGHLRADRVAPLGIEERDRRDARRRRATRDLLRTPRIARLRPCGRGSTDRATGSSAPRRPSPTLRPMSRTMRAATSTSSPFDFAICAVRQVEVVLEPARMFPPSTSAVASIRHSQWLMPMTSHSLPGGIDLRLELEALDHRRDAAEHVHDERELERLLQDRPCRAAARCRACARCRSTRARASRRLVHRREELDDLRVRVREHHVEDEGLLLLGVLRVVHRAHVEGGDLGLALADVRALLGHVVERSCPSRSSG